MSQSDYARIPIAELYTIGRTLTGVKTELDGVEGALTNLRGVDDVHGLKVQNAVDSFFTEWKTSRRTLLENVGGLGDVSTQIAETTDQFDTEVASSLGEFAAKLQEANSGDSASGGSGAM